MAGIKRFVALILLVAMAWLSGCQTKVYEPIDSKTSLIIVVNYLEKSLSFYDEETRKEITRWEMPFPFTGARLLPDNKTLLVYGKELNGIYLYDLESGKQAGKWKLGKGIANAVLSSDRSKVYLASHEEDAILVMSLDGNQTAEIAVGNDPLTMVESKRGDELYVLNFHGSTISVVDLAAYRLKKTLPAKQGSTGAVLIEPLGELWTGGHGAGNYVESKVTVYSIDTGEIMGEIDAPVMPVDMEQEGRFVFVISHGSNQLRKIDVHTKRVEASIEIGSNPFDISIYNHLLYCVSYDSDELFIVQPDELKVMDTLQTGKGPFQVLFRKGAEHESAKSVDH